MVNYIKPDGLAPMGRTFVSTADAAKVFGIPDDIEQYYIIPDDVLQAVAIPDDVKAATAIPPDIIQALHLNRADVVREVEAHKQRMQRAKQDDRKRPAME